jgi:hypothetical protein
MAFDPSNGSRAHQHVQKFDVAGARVLGHHAERGILDTKVDVGDAALVEREAVTLPLDHAFSFQLVDVRAAAVEVHRQC